MKIRYLLQSLVVLLLLLIAANYYFSDRLPKAMVNRVIQESMEGGLSDLAIRSQDKETLQRFFGSELATKDLDYSGDFTRANPDLPELLYIFEHIDYDQNNSIRQMITGNLAIQMTRQSFFKWKIKQVRIINELQINQ
ncbi:hypothetical protein [Paenibacillus tepidiphilus]|uniref:hypothetical protein n=1 Tax=Paenibacillus tepidiphilus TaxID=2608683 RepID=UPI0012391E1E|nr:hypothetical protein [Paenibacillus tepidiphilus]